MAVMGKWRSWACIPYIQTMLIGGSNQTIADNSFSLFGGTIPSSLLLTFILQSM
jgi:hypothetical protein